MSIRRFIVLANWAGLAVNMIAAVVCIVLQEPPHYWLVGAACNAIVLLYIGA
jgi:hypothetical protein